MKYTVTLEDGRRIEIEAESATAAIVEGNSTYGRVVKVEPEDAPIAVPDAVLAESGGAPVALPNAEASDITPAEEARIEEKLVRMRYSDVAIGTPMAGRQIFSEIVRLDMPPMQILDTDSNRPGHAYAIGCGSSELARINFQRGPIKEFGVNGWQDYHLLEIIKDRLEYFQTGPHGCAENAVALVGIEQALVALYRRKENREKYGVEGTSGV